MSRRATRTYWRDVCRSGVAHKLIWTREEGALGYQRACDANKHPTIYASATYWPKAPRRCKVCQRRKVRKQ